MTGTIASDDVVAVFGTGLVQTVVRRQARSGFSWSRRAGPLADGQLPRPDPGLSAAVAGMAEVGDGGVRLVLPGRPGHRYHAPGPRSAAEIIGTDPVATRQLVAAGTFEALGAVLAGLHAANEAVRTGATTAAPGDADGAATLGPPTVTWSPAPPRVRRWLGCSGQCAPDGGRALAAGPGATGRLGAHLMARLGVGRMDLLRAWATPAFIERPVAVHGWASLGLLVPAQDGTRSASLLTGESLTLGSPAGDVGWLLGELLEFSWTTAADPCRQELLEAAARGLARGHRRRSALLAPDLFPALDATGTGRAAVLRVFTHTHDFAAYVSWADELTGHVDRLAELVDEEGRPAWDLAAA